MKSEEALADMYVKALGGSALATPSRWPRWSRAITHRVQSICSRHRKMSLFREGGPRRREGREFSEGGINSEGHRFSVRFSGTKNPDGERPAFSKTGFLSIPPALQLMPAATAGPVRACYSRASCEMRPGRAAALPGLGLTLPRPLPPLPLPPCLREPLPPRPSSAHAWHVQV